MGPLKAKTAPSTTKLNHTYFSNWIVYGLVCGCILILGCSIWINATTSESLDAEDADSAIHLSQHTTNPSPPDPNDPWYQRNSIDPDRGPKPDKVTQREAESAWRLRTEKGIHVERLNAIQRQTKSGDFIDAHGKTYNMVGNCDPRFVQPDKLNVESVIQSARNHLSHDGLDFVVVDLYGFGPQGQIFLNWYKTIDNAMTLRIIIIGAL